MPSVHQPVLVEAVVRGLAAAPGKHYLDGTFGDGGHTRALLAATAPSGQVLAIDWDATAIGRGQAWVSEHPKWAPRFILVQGNFKNLAEIARAHRFTPTGGCLLDLGLSSPQLDDPDGGYSFRGARLDLRFDPSLVAQSAADVVNRQSTAQLATIFREYGEEPLAWPIALAIVKSRRQLPLQRADRLAEIVAEVYRRRFRSRSRRHPATRVFMALRIAVNDELTNLRQALQGAVAMLPPSGRIAVLSYHSLEDRIVKQFFKTESRGCLCSPDAPLCQCAHQPTLQVLTRKPIRPQRDEVKVNPRSRSAKLRIAIKLGGTPLVHQGIVA